MRALLLSKLHARFVVKCTVCVRKLNNISAFTGRLLIARAPLGSHKNEFPSVIGVEKRHKKTPLHFFPPSLSQLFRTPNATNELRIRLSSPSCVCVSVVVTSDSRTGGGGGGDKKEGRRRKRQFGNPYLADRSLLPSDFSPPPPCLFVVEGNGPRHIFPSPNFPAPPPERGERTTCQLPFVRRECSFYRGRRC